MEGPDNMWVTLSVVLQNGDVVDNVASCYVAQFSWVLFVIRQGQPAQDYRSNPAPGLWSFS